MALTPASGRDTARVTVEGPGTINAARDAPEPLVRGPVYLDHNATTPVDPLVAAAMQPHLTEHFGNPSSAHAYAAAPRAAVAAARSQVAALLGCAPADVVFTGSGSEADNLAVRGAALARRDRGDHVITQVTEHPAVLQTCRALERLHGFRVTYLPVDEWGRLAPEALARAIRPGTVLVTVMHANSETGTVQPIAELARIAREHGVLFHTDAAQSVGKLPTVIDELGVDLLTVVGHKLYAPKGVGALYRRPGVGLEPVLYGGGQEGGLRAGTENVAAVVGLGEAARLAGEALGGVSRLQALRDRLHRRLEDRLPGRVQLNGHPTQRLPNTLNVSIRGCDGATLLARTPEVAASTGSACHSGSTAGSPVLVAMGLDPDRARGALRLTVGRWTTHEDVDVAADALAAAASTGPQGTA
jgi:cysteine desulfurase